MDTEDEVLLFAERQIALWTDDERSIHIKAISTHGDPVELNAEEAKELAATLLRLASIVE